MRAALGRRRFLGLAARGAAAGLGGAAFGRALWAQEAARRRLNVLFIAVDDLKPMLGCYGDTMVKSPNIDKLAARGTTFLRAYCQQAVCSPSRNSLLTGKRPDTIGIYDLQTHFRVKLPDVVTLPQQFKENGYHTERFGKIFHTGHGNYDDRRSWTLSPGPFGPPAPEKQAASADEAWGASLRLAGLAQQPRRPQNGPPTGAPDVPDSQLGDGKIADNAIQSLRARKGEDKPFFLAVGFLKPHLPFIAPKKYWDLYDPAQFELAKNPHPPKGAPPYASNGVGELRTYAGVPKQGPVPDEQARHLIHGYHACISYMDAQVGRILDELDRQGLADKTVVILWGDHGFQLGELGNWCKHNNYENATRAPLIVHVPGQKNAGAKTAALTEFVDIYPSLCDLAGIPKPDGLEGTSFAPLLDDPKRPWKQAAFSQWPRRVQNQMRGMGHSLRTDRYRFTEWTLADDPGFSETELYDYQADPHETENLAAKPEHARLTADLKARLRAGWRAALPERKAAR